MSASMCLIAWNEPIGRPKAKRSERVVARHLERAVGAAHLLEGHQHRGAVEHAARGSAPALAGRAQRLGRRAVEARCAPGCGSGRRSAAASRVHARRRQVDEVQRRAPSPPSRLARRPRRSRRRRRRPPAALAPVSLPPATRGRQIAAASARPAPSASAKRADRLAAGQLRQPALLLRLGAGAQQQLGGQVDRRGERHRRHARGPVPRRSRRARDSRRPGRRRPRGWPRPGSPCSARPFHSAAS